MLKETRGESKLGLLVLLAIVTACIYVGFKWGSASWEAAKFREAVNQSIVYWTSHGPPPKENIIFEILQKAEENKIDLYEEDIELDLRDRFLTFSIEWETPLTFPGGYTYYIPFTMEREVQLR